MATSLGAYRSHKLDVLVLMVFRCEASADGAGSKRAQVTPDSEAHPLCPLKKEKHTTAPFNRNLRPPKKPHGSYDVL